MTDPNDRDPAGPDDDARSDEDRDISDVGLPHPDDEQGEAPVDEAALDEVFPPADR